MPMYIIVEKAKVEEALRTLNRKQNQTGYFCNLEVLPYRGHKYDPSLYKTIKIG